MMDWQPYYDRDGNPISRDEGVRLLESADSRQVAHDLLGAGPVSTSVSTVHLVINHGFGAGPPLIFETMIFSTDPAIDRCIWRWATEEQAAEGHRRIIAWLKGEGPHPDHEG